MDASGVVFVNGEYRPVSEGIIAVRDRGFLYGDAIFDTVSAWKGSLFKLDEHLDRLDTSLRSARLDVDFDRAAWREAIAETVRRNGLRDAAVRIIVTRGVPPTMTADPRDHAPTVVIWASPYYFLANETQRQEGLRLMISHLRSLPAAVLDPRYKSVVRLHFQLGRLDAFEAGYDDALFLSEAGYVTETWASNIFAVDQGVLHTPGKDILRGITRQTIFELADRLGLDCRETDLTPFDLYNADELFIATTAGGLMPVQEVSGRRVRASVPGEVTQELTRAYWELRESGEHGTAIDYDVATASTPS